MKKTKFKFSLLYILLTITPMIVLADSVGPTLPLYDAIVVNTDGATCIEKNLVIPANTVIQVLHNYEKENTIQTMWQDVSCEIKATDIIPYNEEFNPNNHKSGYASADKMNKRIIITEENGVRLNKGPSNVYQKYNKTVPFGQKLTITYYLSNWYYIDDAGYKGWISFGYKNLTDIVLFNDTKLYDTEGNVIDNISKETLLKDTYTSDKKNFKLIVNYNNKTGYIGLKDDKNFLYGQYGLGFENRLKWFDDLFNYQKIGKDVQLTTKDYTITIPKYSIIKILAYYYYSMYGYEPVCYNIENRYYNSDGCYFYVEYEGNKGFISASRNDLHSNITEEEKATLKEFNTPSVTPPPTNSPTTDTELKENNLNNNNNNEPKSNEFNNPTSKNIIIYAVISSIIISIIIIIIISNINKKKVKKMN